MHSGNAFGTTAVLGTTDPFGLEVRVHGARAMFFGPDPTSPNLVGGSAANVASPGVRGAAVGGGGVAVGTDPDYGSAGPNVVFDAYGTISGGLANHAGDGAGTSVDRAFASVGGGYLNEATGYASTVSGGTQNAAIDNHGTVTGGANNRATGSYASIGGGGYNEAAGPGSVIGGGGSNSVDGRYGTVAGGLDNLASGAGATVGGGGTYSSSPPYVLGVGNTASGRASTVPGGVRNVASGDFSLAGGAYSEARGNYSVALGYSAKTFLDANSAHGAFVFADASQFSFGTGTPNRFAVRATGGVQFVLGINSVGTPTWVCQATNGSPWSCSSDHGLKQDLVALNGVDVLEKLDAMPIYAWSPKGANARVRHYGPMAQDFHAAFGLGDDDTMIGMQDADGVALAAIQGLNAKLEAKLAAQAREIAALRSMVQRLTTKRR